MLTGDPGRVVGVIDVEQLDRRSDPEPSRLQGLHGCRSGPVGGHGHLRQTRRCPGVAQSEQPPAAVGGGSEHRFVILEQL
jgi:hypothetical protein